MHFLGVILSAVSSYWYTAFYHLVIYLVSSNYAPNYSRLSGFTGNYAITPKVYCWIFSVLYLVICGASAALSALKWMAIVVSGCYQPVLLCPHLSPLCTVWIAGACRRSS